MATALLAQPTVKPSIPEAPLEDEPLYEVVDGQIVENVHMAVLAVHLATRLVIRLGFFADNAKLGRVESEMLYLLDADSGLKRRPDLSFVSYDRWPRTMSVPSEDGWPVVPDLAVEVVGPSYSAIEIKRKIREYFAAGVRMVWVVYPDETLIEAYNSPTTIRILDRSGTIEGGDILPGFQLALTELFEDLTADKLN